MKTQNIVVFVGDSEHCGHIAQIDFEITLEQVEKLGSGTVTVNCECGAWCRAKLGLYGYFDVVGDETLLDLVYEEVVWF